jgi:phosphocarrier protein
MLSVSGLNVEHGESVRVVAEGPDAEAALDAVCELLTTPVEGAGDEGDSGPEGAP